MKNLNKELQALGLSAVEASVYLACLELSGGVVSDIATRAKVERTNCYYVLKTLLAKGLISSSNQGSTRYYLAEPPDKIVKQQKQKLALAEEILPQLISLEQNTKTLSPKMRYYEGMEGMISLFERSLETRNELLCYTNIKLLIDKFPNYLLEHCRRQSSLEIHSRIISSYNNTLNNFPEYFFPEEYIKRYLQLLFINPKEFGLQDNIFIYEDQVSVISLKTNQYLGVLIESESYAETSRTIFNLSWLGATTFVVQ